MVILQYLSRYIGQKYLAAPHFRAKVVLFIGDLTRFPGHRIT